MNRTLLLLAFLGGPVWAQNPFPNSVEAPADSYELGQGTILQPSTQKAFLTVPTGEVQAIDVPTGKTLWHTAQPAYALLVRGNRLLALLSPPKGKWEWRLGILDARNGKVLTRLPVMKTFQYEVGERINNSLYLKGLAKDGHDYLVSDYRWWPTPGGANRGPDYKYPPGASGEKVEAFTVDLAAGRVIPLEGDVPDDSIKMVNNPGGGFHSEPFELGDLKAQVAMELKGTRYQLVLRRWNAADLGEILLGEPPWNSCGVVVSQDHAMALGVYQVPERSNPFLYHFNAYSIASGEKIAEADTAAWPSMVQPCGDFLVCYFPNLVFSVDLKTGKEKWNKNLKSLRYEGSYPPTANRPSIPSAKPR